LFIPFFLFRLGSDVDAVASSSLNGLSEIVERWVERYQKRRKVGGSYHRKVGEDIENDELVASTEPLTELMNLVLMSSGLKENPCLIPADTDLEALNHDEVEDLVSFNGLSSLF
jgi:hypothetical protein